MTFLSFTVLMLGGYIAACHNGAPRWVVWLGCVVAVLCLAVLLYIIFIWVGL